MLVALDAPYVDTRAADRARLDVPASTLLQPRVLEYAREEWRGY